MAQSVAASHKFVILPAICKNVSLENDSMRNIFAEIRSMVKITEKCFL